MKLIYAIVRNDNEDDVMDALNKDHFQVTKLASTGGFLRKGNSTLMIATQDDMVDECIELIKKQCGKRQKITVNMPYVSGTSMGTYTTMPMPVVSAPASGRTPLSTSSAPLSPASLATLHTPRSFAGAARPGPG